MYARANPRMYTPETVSHLDSNLCDTPDTPDTPETVSHLDSNLCETGDTSVTPETPETLETLETLGSIFFRMKDDANV